MVLGASGAAPMPSVSASAAEPIPIQDGQDEQAAFLAAMSQAAAAGGETQEKEDLFSFQNMSTLHPCQHHAL